MHNPVLALLCGVGAMALAGAGFMSDAPNRLADGVAQPIWHAPGLAIALVAVPFAGLTAMAVTPPGRRRDAATLVAAVALLFGAIAAAGLFAKALTVSGHPAQRHALAVGFWMIVGIAALAALDAVRRLDLGIGGEAVLILGIGLALAGLIASGLLDRTSLAREFASHHAVFLTELVRHVALVGAALAASILVCAPLVLAIRRSARVRAAAYPVLSVLQTIPSIALFGLLIAPLTVLAAHVLALKSLGVSGLGTTPALIALVLYSAFPLVRMSDAAFAAVPGDVADAATGLGFGRRRKLLAVDLPLALPVLVAGLRVVTLQAIGLATVAALIGGGGLGTFIFEGIGEYALDLVLVGALPVVALALAADFGFRVARAAVEIPA